MKYHTLSLAAAAIAFAAAFPATAQQQPPVFKCVSKGAVIYSHVPCPGGTELGEKKAKADEKLVTPPQDRAKAARRAALKPEVREQCETMEARINEEEARLKTLSTVTPTDEKEVLNLKIKSRELRC
jgi:hypothetical protein